MKNNTQRIQPRKYDERKYYDSMFYLDLRWRELQTREAELTADKEDRLYVVKRRNHRVQNFKLK